MNETRGGPASLGTLRAVLGRRGHPAVLCGLIEAMPTARGAALSALALTLAGERHPAAGLAVLGQWHRLDGATRAALEGRLDELRPAVEKALGRGSRGGGADPAAALAAVALVQQTGDARLAWRVLEHLRRAGPGSAPAAAACLVCLAEGDPGDAGLHGLLDDAARAHAAHGQDEPLLAALARAGRPVPGLREALGRSASASVAVARRQVADPVDPRIVRRLLAIGRLPNLMHAAGQGLAAAHGRGGLGDALHDAHLLALDDTAASLHRAPGAASLWPDDTQRPAWSARAQRGLPAWSAALPAEAERTTKGSRTGATDLAAHAARLGQLTACDRATRWSAVRRLLLLTPRGDAQRDAVCQALAGFCHDEDAALAAAAARELVRRRPAGLSTLAADWVHAPAAAVRALASEVLAPVAFEGLWSRWDQASGAQRRAAGAALVRLDAALPQRLGSRLASRSRGDRLRALSMVRGLGLAGVFEGTLIALAAHADARTASAAVPVLAGVAGERATAALRAATRHADARVRANAIEATPGEVSPAACADEANRPRANAIARRLDAGEADALPTLREMLVDARPMHRVSALWVSADRRVAEAAPVVAELAAADRDPAVRRRASAAFAQLLRDTRGPVDGSAPAGVRDGAGVAEGVGA